MIVYASTDAGKIRPVNEDSYYLPRQDEPFCAIADGMGGHNAGDVASSLAVEIFAETMRMMSLYTSLALQTAITRANGLVYEQSLRDESKRGMGTTFTALALDGDTVRVAHVGDSRAYLIRNNAIVRVTTDHTVVEEMLMRGEITPKQALTHPMRNYITRALGTEARIDVDLYAVDARPDDVYLLCTDGVSKFVDENKMLAIVRSAQPWQDKADALVHAAMQLGSRDNVTAMLVTFEGAHA